MLRRMTMVGLTVIVALVVPSGAGAAELTNPAKLVEAGIVPTGTTITFAQAPAAHIGMKTTTLGKIECGSVGIAGTVTKNSGGEFAAKIDGGIGRPCTVNGKSGAEIVAWSGRVVSSSSGIAASDFELTVHIPNVGTCLFFTPAGNPAAGVFTSGSATVTLTNAELESSPEQCGEATIAGGLTLARTFVFQTTESGGTQMRQLMSFPEVVPVGSQVTLSQDPAKPLDMAALLYGRVTCPSLSASGVLVKNREGIVDISLTSGSGEACTIHGYPQVTKITNIIGEVVLQGAEEASASYGLEMLIPTAGLCTFNTSQSAGQQMSFVRGTNELYLNPGSLHGSQGYCGDLEVRGGLLVSTVTGTPLSVQ